MQELVRSISQYLIDIIKQNLKSEDLSFNWNYHRNTFTINFDLVNTKFIIIAKSNNLRKYGMAIEPDENKIKIICYNYIDNFEQTVGILVEFEKELLFFDESFPILERRNFIRDNYLSIFPQKSGVAQINILSRKYLREHKLKDRCGAKEIALDHLFGREYRLINAPKKINAAQAKTLKNLGITAKTEKEACDKLIAALEKEGIKGMEDESLAALIDMADGILGSDEVEDDTDE